MKRVGVFRPVILVALAIYLAALAGLCPASYAEDTRRDLALHYYRGVVNFEAGRYENALVEFQAVAALDPYYKDTQKYVGDCVKVLEEGREKLYDSKELQAGSKKDVDLYFLGKAYYEKGDYRRALDVFKSVLAKNPNDLFARYYAKLCQNNLPGGQGHQKPRISDQEERVENVGALEKEVSYMKNDIKEQQDTEHFLETKALRKENREELIRSKEKQLKEQEEILEEEKQDYLAQANIEKRAQKIKRESEKWKTMKERLASAQPGMPADLTSFPIYLNKADSYYKAMKEALRNSRWNSAGLNAIDASLYYCDTVLIYFYGVKSAEPKHENITRLLLNYVKRSDVEENIFHLRSILNLKKIVEGEDRPITRSEAIFLSDHAQKLAEWCKSILP